MSGHEILDLLFDKDDPLLKDIENFMEEDITHNLEPFQSICDPAQENINPCDFWNSFLKDSESESYMCNTERCSNEVIDIDSISHCSESFSKHSSSESENADTVIVIDEYSTDHVTVLNQIKGNHSYALPSDMYNETSIQDSPDAIINLGADVVVFTSELSGNAVELNEIPQTQKSVVLNIEKYPKLLHLTEEERKLIKKEGLHIPTNMPLTKAEEKELKRIRRKIRNKQSAQESRQRKKEYVDGLEARIKICTTENLRLQKKVQNLENEQRSLLDQIKNLKSMLSDSGKSVHSSTCLLILFLSFALVILPSLFSCFESKALSTPKQEISPVSGNARVLLSAQNVETNSIDIKMESVNTSHDNFNINVKKEFDDKMYPQMSDTMQVNIPARKKRHLDVSYEMHSSGLMNNRPDVLQNNYTYDPKTINNIKNEITLALD